MPKTCPYHNKLQPCEDCQSKGMGAFAFSGRPYTGSKAPPSRVHNHGSTRPCSLRCGVNEGIFVLNAHVGVSCLFTDGLLNCAQVILRNGTATFTCHIIGTAKFPVTFMTNACTKFIDEYDMFNACYVISASDSPALGNRIDHWFKQQFGITAHRVTDCGGCSIAITTGVVSKTPGAWNPSRDYVAGFLTAPDLIDFRIISRTDIGEPLPGDFFEGCLACSSLFS